jgi:hypothetical protein
MMDALGVDEAKVLHIPVDHPEEEIRIEIARRAESDAF